MKNSVEDSFSDIENSKKLKAFYDAITSISAATVHAVGIQPVLKMNRIVNEINDLFQKENLKELEVFTIISYFYQSIFAEIFADKLNQEEISKKIN